mgnify:CR=1 FL=1
MERKFSPDEIHNMISEANLILNGIVHRTPLDRSRTFSEMTGGEIYLKLENLQKNGIIQGERSLLQNL